MDLGRNGSPKSVTRISNFTIFSLTLAAIDNIKRLNRNQQVARDLHLSIKQTLKYSGLSLHCSLYSGLNNLRSVTVTPPHPAGPPSKTHHAHSFHPIYILLTYLHIRALILLVCTSYTYSNVRTLGTENGTFGGRPHTENARYLLLYNLFLMSFLSSNFRC